MQIKKQEFLMKVLELDVHDQ
jgi:hypothetical protein